MNIILFDESELERPLPLSDLRAKHIVEVLRTGPGDSVDAGVIGGYRGKAVVRRIGTQRMDLDFRLDTPCELPAPIDVILGMPRPQSARDVLRETASMGVRRLIFTKTEKGEASYARSRLWSQNLYRDQLISGASLAFTTHLPEVVISESLEHAVSGVDSRCGRYALDNYESSVLMGHALREYDGSSVTIAVGAERGWSTTERDLLRDAEFVLSELGSRVLRVETATIAAVSIVLAAMGRM